MSEYDKKHRFLGRFMKRERTPERPVNLPDSAYASMDSTGNQSDSSRPYPDSVHIDDNNDIPNLREQDMEKNLSYKPNTGEVVDDDTGEVVTVVTTTTTTTTTTTRKPGKRDHSQDVRREVQQGAPTTEAISSQQNPITPQPGNDVSPYGPSTTSGTQQYQQGNHVSPYGANTTSSTQQHVTSTTTNAQGHVPNTTGDRHLDAPSTSINTPGNTDQRNVTNTSGDNNQHHTPNSALNAPGNNNQHHVPNSALNAPGNHNQHQVPNSTLNTLGNNNQSYGPNTGINTPGNNNQSYGTNTGLNTPGNNTQRHVPNIGINTPGNTDLTPPSGYSEMPATRTPRYEDGPEPTSTGPSFPSNESSTTKPIPPQVPPRSPNRRSTEMNRDSGYTEPPTRQSMYSSGTLSPSPPTSPSRHNFSYPSRAPPGAAPGAAPSALNTAVSPTNEYGVRHSPSTLQNLKAAAVGIHGVGETLRGTFASEVDRRFPGRNPDKAAVVNARNQAVLDRGQREMAGLPQRRVQETDNRSSYSSYTIGDDSAGITPVSTTAAAPTNATGTAPGVGNNLSHTTSTGPTNTTGTAQTGSTVPRSSGTLGKLFKRKPVPGE